MVKTYKTSVQALTVALINAGVEFIEDSIEKSFYNGKVYFVFEFIINDKAGEIITAFKECKENNEKYNVDNFKEGSRIRKEAIDRKFPRGDVNE